MLRCQKATGPGSSSLSPYFCLYSPEFLEEKFSEVRSSKRSRLLASKRLARLCVGSIGVGSGDLAPCVTPLCSKRLRLATPLLPEKLLRIALALGVQKHSIAPAQTSKRARTTYPSKIRFSGGSVILTVFPSSSTTVSK
jgi:hypothetical protein